MFWPRKTRKLDERLRRAGWYVSGSVHVCLIAAVLGCYLAGVEIPVIDAMMGQAKTMVRADYWEQHEFADITKIIDDEVRQLIQPEGEKKAIDPRLTLSSVGEPQVANPPDSPSTEKVDLGDFVKSRVERGVEESAKIDDETKLAQLEKRSQDLGKVATEESINELSIKFQKWLGNDKRAEKPADKPVAGSFDFNTAQLHDVRREGNENDGYTYASILIDAAGRTFEAPMSKEEGETAYRTMQLIKSNPLLEKVYRGIVMGMLDKMLKPDEGKKP